MTSVHTEKQNGKQNGSRRAKKANGEFTNLEQAGLRATEVVPIYIGDDVTDEDAFVAVASTGTGIVVSDEDRVTAATKQLKDPAEVRSLLRALTIAMETSRTR